MARKAKENSLLCTVSFLRSSASESETNGYIWSPYFIVDYVRKKDLCAARREMEFGILQDRTKFGLINCNDFIDIYI